MSTISIQIPDSIKNHVERLARKDGITVDQFLSTAAAEKLAALEAESYIADRARKADDKAFEKVMEKVPNIEPEEWDKIP